MEIFAHRNLNKTKTLGWDVWVYSHGTIKGKTQRGKVFEDYPDTLTLENVQSVRNLSGLKKIYEGDYRSVCIWLVGTPTPKPIHTENARRFSINPKKGELEFNWSDTKEPVQFPLKRVEMRRDGTYGISY